MTRASTEAARRRPRTRGYAGALFVVAALSLSYVTSASAHGRPPYVERVAFDPSDPDRLVLQTTFGLVTSSDGGASWRWICAAAYRADPTSEDPDVVITPEGATVVGGFAGLGRSERSLCEWTFPAGPGQDTFIVDLERDPAVPTTIWAVASSGVEADWLLRSEDEGERWERVGQPIDEILVERMARAPSDPGRIYLTGAIPAGAEPRRGFLLRSDDGGARFERIEIPLLDGERFPLIEAVDPTNPDRIFIQVSRRVVDLRPNRLLYAEDGGRTLETVLELDRMRAVAISDDGRTVWAGSAERGGVVVARDGSLAFEPISDLDVRCLATRGDELWMCVDQHREGFALGVSTDGGATVEPRFWLDRVRDLPECGRCSTTGFVCPAWAPDLAYDQAVYFGDDGDGGIPLTGTPRDAGDISLCSADGSVEPGDVGAGCGCRAAGVGGASVTWPLLALLLLATRRRRRRHKTRREGNTRCSRFGEAWVGRAQPICFRGGRMRIDRWMAPITALLVGMPFGEVLAQDEEGMHIAPATAEHEELEPASVDGVPVPLQRLLELAARSAPPSRTGGPRPRASLVWPGPQARRPVARATV